jgi:hypothetical protein
MPRRGSFVDQSAWGELAADDLLAQAYESLLGERPRDAGLLDESSEL